MMKLSAESKTKIQKDKELEAQKKAPQLILRPPGNQLINFIVLSREPGGFSTLELQVSNNGLDSRRGFWLEIPPDDETPGFLAPGIIRKFLHSKLRVERLSSPYMLCSGHNSNGMMMSFWIAEIPWESRMEMNFQYRLKTTATPVYLSWVPQKRNLLKNFLALCV